MTLLAHALEHGDWADLQDTLQLMHNAAHCCRHQPTVRCMRTCAAPPRASWLSWIFQIGWGVFRYLNGTPAPHTPIGLIPGLLMVACTYNSPPTLQLLPTKAVNYCNPLTIKRCPVLPTTAPLPYATHYEGHHLPLTEQQFRTSLLYQQAEHLKHSLLGVHQVVAFTFTLDQEEVTTSMKVVRQALIHIQRMMLRAQQHLRTMVANLEALHQMTTAHVQAVGLVQTLHLELPLIEGHSNQRTFCTIPQPGELVLDELCTMQRCLLHVYRSRARLNGPPPATPHQIREFSHHASHTRPS
jgi:hypothetical protein